MKTADKLIRKSEVKEIIPWSDSQIYAKIREGEFPPPIRQGRISLWSLNEILNYVETLKAGPRGVSEANVKNRALLNKEAAAA